mgnify:CR=1 FL=1
MPDDSEFCPYCGTKLDQTQAPDPQPVAQPAAPAEQPVYAPQAAPAPAPVPAPAPAPAAEAQPVPTPVVHTPAPAPAPTPAPTIRNEQYDDVEGDGFEEDIDEYTSEGIFFVPANARWSVIASKAHTPEIGTVIDDAMRAIEKENKRLRMEVELMRDFLRCAGRR